MDDIVKQAMVKWPSVPHCYGWLGLDARGNWFMRDEQAQASGSFRDGGAQAKGSLLKHDKLIEFIARNYEADGQGRWYFQNGPQRVYVELELTPWVWRLSSDFFVRAHTGRVAMLHACWLDEQGRVYLDTDIGFGLVHTMDVSIAAEAVLQGLWVPLDTLSLTMPERFGYVCSPDLERSNQATAP
ncbi:DUF2946 family protein [Rhodoferax sp.]|uniref:DUF2946 family protein n=1 Tax=Rhodoferax sp. TaxID=50421 RepID=UPI0027473F3C|nr:DUF2946 family protein [Rhodoferax sp.]